MTLRAQIETAIVAALAPKLLTNGGYLADVRAYNGELETPDEDAFRIATTRRPCILVATGRAKYHSLQTSRRREAARLEVGLLLISGKLSTREDRTRGDTAIAAGEDPGIYKMLEDARAVLQASSLGLAGVGPLVPDTEQPMLHAPDVTVWSAVYETLVDATLVAEDANDPALTDLRQQDGLPVEADTTLQTVLGGTFAVVGTTVTYTAPLGTPAFPSAFAGARVWVQGATSPGNDGFFGITAVPVGGNKLVWQNPHAVAETLPAAGSVTVTIADLVEADDDPTT